MTLGCDRHHPFQVGPNGNYFVCQSCGNNAHDSYDFAEQEEKLVADHKIEDFVQEVMPKCVDWENNKWAEANESWMTWQRKSRCTGIRFLRAEQVDDYLNCFPASAERICTNGFLKGYIMDMLCLRSAIELSHLFPEACRVVERPSIEVLSL